MQWKHARLLENSYLYLEQFSKSSSNSIESVVFVKPAMAVPVEKPDIIIGIDFGMTYTGNGQSFPLSTGS
jgi:hypothetical protein